MTINCNEQRELADNIAHELTKINVRWTLKEIADIAWQCIEDYTVSDPDGPDILELAKARMEADPDDLPDEAYDPHDFADIRRYE